jgi:hypothetical protein
MVTTADLPPAPPEDDAPSAPDPRPTPVKGPALVVLGVSLVLVVAGVLGSALVSGTTPTLTVHRLTLPDGTAVDLTPASTAMHAIVGAGEPPADILGNLAVPTGSRVTSTANSDQNQAQFDRTVHYASTLTADQLVAVYQTLLPKLGWQVLYVGDAARSGRTGSEVLAKHGSGDGFYWEIGAVVSPTTPAGVTPYSLELFELPDGN